MKMKLGDGTSIPASKLQYGLTFRNMKKNAVGTLYLLANTMLFDDFEPTPIHASGTPLSVTPNPSTNRWTYYAFSNDATTANDQLQLVFKLNSLVASAGSGMVFPSVLGS